MSNSTHIIKRINKCWNIQGLYNQICQVEMESGNSGLVSVSNRVKEPETLQDWIQINCDPEKDVCPIPDYVFNKYKNK